MTGRIIYYESEAPEGFTSGYRTYRKLGDPLARLCVACPKGTLEEVCAQAFIAPPGDAGALKDAIRTANYAVLRLMKGCPVHDDAGLLPGGPAVDAAALATSEDEIRQALIEIFEEGAGPKVPELAPVPGGPEVPYEGEILIPEVPEAPESPEGEPEDAPVEEPEVAE